MFNITFRDTQHTHQKFYSVHRYIAPIRGPIR